MKIAVIANCQGSNIAKCLKAMNSDIHVEDIFVHSKFDYRDKISEFDAICSQPSLNHEVADYVRSTGKDILYFPEMVFSGFHPDLVAMFSNGTQLSGPLGHYHSSLIFLGWSNGLTVEQTLGLFCDEVFEEAGYYKKWQHSCSEVLARGESCGMNLRPLLEKWINQGCFMHSINHPKLFALADIAKEICKKLGVTIKCQNPEKYLIDSLMNSVIWPVYPEIGARHGISGDYVFFRAPQLLPGQKENQTIFLEELAVQYFEFYSQFNKDEMSSSFSNLESYKALEKFAMSRVFSSSPVKVPTKGAEHSSEPAAQKSKNPYSGLPPYQFWKKSIEQVAVKDVDPVVKSAFQIERSQKIATAGSCFAQHIAHRLRRSGFQYYVPESAPLELSSEEAEKRNYGVFSARYGNIYTAKQLVQLFDRAYGNFSPHDFSWVRHDGKYIDPFRPQIEPDGFSTVEELLASQAAHFSSVRQMFEKLDVFIFTLGLTEAWRSKVDGAVFPLAPGVSGGEMNPDLYEFVNFSAAEVTSDLENFISRLRHVNSTAKIILTVSPVPLIATYEDRHVLVSTTYSKSALRVAAEVISKNHHDVAYFPSYEIITGSFNKAGYYGHDMRTVTSDGVEHVMRLFLLHYSKNNGKEVGDISMALKDTANDEAFSTPNIVCDEEEIVSMNRH